VISTIRRPWKQLQATLVTKKEIKQENNKKDENPNQQREENHKVITPINLQHTFGLPFL